MKALGLVFSEDDEDVVMKALRTLQKSSSVKIYPDSPAYLENPARGKNWINFSQKPLKGLFTPVKRPKLT